MAKTWLAKIKGAIVEVRDFLDEKAIGSVNRGQLSRVFRFAHFWLMVAKSFNRNRCPVRAAALAYTTLLAFVPMLAVALSFTSAILKDNGTQRIRESIDRFVTDIAPPPAVETNFPDFTPAPGETNDALAPVQVSEPGSSPGRQEMLEQIDSFVQKVQHLMGRGSVGALSGFVFVFIAIMMLSRVEETFNDIWGVSKGRTWLSRTLLYWAVITLGPILLTAGVGLATGSRGQVTHRLMEHPLFHFVPVVLLCLALAVFYLLMPHTRVRYDAALVGGVVGGVLWHINNYYSFHYASTWVTNSRIYGSLAVIPVFMIGLYFSWLIFLFGAQVAYAWQNRAAYVQQKQAENINQRGREFIALRLMQRIGQRFLRGERPATVPEMADALVVPTRLVEQIMHTLLIAGLVVEVMLDAKGRETAYSPARPLETISGHDILAALRVGQGQELETCDDSGRAEVFGEFERILEAERKAASAVNVLTMARRAEDLALPGAPGTRAVTDRKQNEERKHK